MTRSTGWVRVVGFGKEMDGLLREYERIKSKGFTFEFVYPTRQQQSYLRSVFKEAGEEPAFVEPWHLKMIAAGTVEQIRNNKIKWDDLERFYLLRDWIRLKEEKGEHRLDLVLDED
ncbi:MAG: hypothetical protein LBC41_14755, partial [Clostridiales bacterium]|jgi:superfamily I DNA and RNA helicase|nr:hypothetical protein [Clostridiales bacterium]